MSLPISWTSAGHRSRQESNPAGAEPPSSTDGISFVPQLTGTPGPERKSAFFWYDARPGWDKERFRREVFAVNRDYLASSAAFFGLPMLPLIRQKMFHGSEEVTSEFSPPLLQRIEARLIQKLGKKLVGQIARFVFLPAERAVPDEGVNGPVVTFAEIRKRRLRLRRIAFRREDSRPAGCSETGVGVGVHGSISV